jgi:hypothetical protein
MGKFKNPICYIASIISNVNYMSINCLQCQSPLNQLSPMSITGTTPIICLVAPTVMVGAFYLQPEDEPIWKTLGGLALTMAAIIMGVLGVASGILEIGRSDTLN